MVEKASTLTDAGAPRSPGAALSGAVYAITAVHYADHQITEVMLGLVDTRLAHWDLTPTPTRLVEVVDRLVEGDTIITLFPGADGRLQPGPQVKVDVLPGGAETLALMEDAPGKRLSDLPRF